MILEVRDLATSYGGIQALRGASIDVREGAFVALIGRNGAGKSTLLNSISGVIAPHSGSVVFDSKPIRGEPDYSISRRGLIQVPEGRRILKSLSVEENLQLGALAGAGRSGDKRSDLDKVFQLFPVLAERRKSAGGVLSGGQQQMLAIGRALMGRPRLLLLDEPSLGLSPLVTQQIFQAFTALHLDGMSMLVVEQNARRALSVSQYAYVIDQGRVVHQGPSAQLMNDPSVISHYLGSLATSELTTH